MTTEDRLRLLVAIIDVATRCEMCGEDLKAGSKGRRCYPCGRMTSRKGRVTLLNFKRLRDEFTEQQRLCYAKILGKRIGASDEAEAVELVLMKNHNCEACREDERPPDYERRDYRYQFRD